MTTAFLYVMLKTGEIVTEYVPAWFCDQIKQELAAGKQFGMINERGHKIPMARYACFRFPETINACELEPNT